MADNPRQDLYLEISRNLVDVELTNLRNYVSGAKILPARFVEKADGHQIFTQLEKEQKLKPGDLSLLVNILRKIGRHDYAEQAEKVAENERKEQNSGRRSAVSDSSSDQETPAKQRKQHLGAKQQEGRFQRKTKVVPVDVSKYFDKVIRGTSANWDDLARKLNFERNEIKGIEEEKRDNDRRCREVLERWRNREGKAATLQALKRALIKINHKLTAEKLELEDSSDSD